MKHHERLPLVPVARGQGAWLYDRDGHRYLDAISSWWVNLFGHANPRINAALKDQLDTLEHAMLAGCTHEPAIELAERLAALTQQHARPCVLRLRWRIRRRNRAEDELPLLAQSRLSRDKQEFVCIANSYHGETIGALGVTDVALFKDAYDPLIRHAHVVASPDARPRNPAKARPMSRAARSITCARCSTPAATKIAALIVEPLVQCAAGMAMHDPSYIAGLRALCDHYGVHLIADEIAVGCGRTGTFFACEQAGIWPDFLCLSKGISGGYLPLSIVLSRDEIFAAFYRRRHHARLPALAFVHGQSARLPRRACHARSVRKRQRARRQRAEIRHLAAALAPLADHPQVRNLRQCGTIFAFDAVIDDAQQAKSSRAVSSKTRCSANCCCDRFRPRSI